MERCKQQLVKSHQTIIPRQSESRMGIIRSELTLTFS